MRRKMLAFGSAVLMSAILPGVGLAQDHPVPDAAPARDSTIPDPVTLTADATTPSRDTSAPATNGGNPAAPPAIESAGEPAATDPAAPDTPAGAASADSQWHLSVSPYLWFPGAHGDIGALGRNVGFHASATDILSHFRFGVMGAVQARHQRLVLSMDLMSVRLAADKGIPAPALAAYSANLTTHSVLFTPKIGLRLINTEKIKIDALSGIRFWYFGEDLSFSPSPLGLNYSASQSWSTLRWSGGRIGRGTLAETGSHDLGRRRRMGSRLTTRISSGRLTGVSNKTEADARDRLPIYVCGLSGQWGRGSRRQGGPLWCSRRPNLATGSSPVSRATLMTGLTLRSIPVLLALAIILSGAGDDDGSRFQVNVDLVQLRVTITDGAGVRVRDLKPQDFQVFENGVDQTIRSVVTPGHSESSSSGVFVLFDTSDQMYTEFAYTEDSVADFIRKLDPSDFVAVYSFARNVTRLARATHDRLSVLTGLRRAVLGDKTALCDALLLTLRDAAGLPGNKSVVVFSNGRDTSSMLSPDNVRQVAQDEGIPIYVLSTRSFSTSTAAFRELTEDTGGRNYLAATRAAQKSAFESIEEDLDASYTITYYPTNRGPAFRNVDVRIAGDSGLSYRVHARAGYRPSHVLP